uniref:Uncharacterized protein n=1 Tax=Vespula pensylvanica TaxID=30213 RepID=A0A834UCJ8_VESPE|nr:hypothetical protein H0235_004283 [Vespula pensylvanica]
MRSHGIASTDEILPRKVSASSTSPTLSDYSSNPQRLKAPILADSQSVPSNTFRSHERSLVSTNNRLVDW